ncbi:MAG: type IV toxin-antitoxin system AbiEi family antitoxin domain-containing protein [Candidatus Heimdallarchaeaceae archaeon]
MGKIIHLKELKEKLKLTPVFRTKDVELIIKNKNYTYLILHNLLKRGEIKRITKSWYSWQDDPTLTVFCFKPAYIGLQEALSIYNLWEQETNVVIITPRKVRSGIREFFGTNIIIHRISPKYFFGFDYLKYGDFFIPVSDIEKTLIDLVYFNEVPEKKSYKRN